MPPILPASNSTESYRVTHEVPSIQTYCDLRATTGLSPKSRAAAAIGLPNSLFAVQIMYKPPPAHSGSDAAESEAQDETEAVPIAMGRVVGDGALFFQVVDIAVHTAHQGKGLGKMLLREIENWINTNVPPTGYVSLVADGMAKELYAKFGFRETILTGSVGMAREIVKEERTTGTAN